MKHKTRVLPKILGIYRGQCFNNESLSEDGLLSFYVKSLKSSPVSSFLLLSDEQVKHSIFMSFYQVTKNIKVSPQILGPQASFILLLNFKFHFREVLIYEGQNTERYFSGETRKRAIIEKLQAAVEESKDSNLRYLLQVSKLVENLDFFLFCSSQYNGREELIQSIKQLLRQLSFRDSFKKNLYMLAGMFYEIQGEIEKSIKSYLVSLNFHNEQQIVYHKVSELYAELGNQRLSEFYKNRSHSTHQKGDIYEAA